MSDVAHRQQIQRKREIVRALRNAGPAGVATAAVATKAGVDTKRAGELLRALERESVVEKVGAPGLGDGQWRLVGGNDE
jgi:predicted transcriptional regulator